jgi:hypothetical protein
LFYSFVKSDDNNKNNSNNSSSSSDGSPNSKWKVFSGFGKKKQQPGRGDGSAAAKHHHLEESSSAYMDNEGAVAKFDQKKGVWVPVRKQVSGYMHFEKNGCFTTITR